jgi:hypothetical protein
VLNEIEERNDSEEQVGRPQFLTLRFCRDWRKGCARKKPVVGALRADGVRNILSGVGKSKWEFKLSG